MEKTGCGSSLDPCSQCLGHPPPPSPCRNLLPGSLEKGTKIKAGFLTLIWAEGCGGGEHQPTPTQTTSCVLRSPHQAHPPPPRRFVTPHLKYLQKRPPRKGNTEGGGGPGPGTPPPPSPTCSQLPAWGSVSGWAASRTISLSGQRAGRCPRGGPQGGTEVGLARPRGGCRRPRRQGPPSQALWRLVSWEAESAPSSEQERVQGDREPGRTPLPGQALWSWVTQTPSTFPGTSLPSSARLLASGGLAPNSPLGELQRGVEGSRPHRCAMPWGGGCGSIPPHFISGEASKARRFPCSTSAGLCRGETVPPHGIVSDMLGSAAVWLVLASW